MNGAHMTFLLGKREIFWNAGLWCRKKCLTLYGINVWLFDEGFTEICNGNSRGIGMHGIMRRACVFSMDSSINK